MIKKGSRLKIVDNSGATLANCVHVFKEPVGKPGSLLKISVRATLPQSKVVKGSMHLAVVVRTAAKYVRPDGSCVYFTENACVLINENKEPKSTRVFGTIMKEVKQKGYIKVSQNAAEVI